MTKLDKLIELTKVEKLNRRNRIEDKLIQQEYYGDIEEFFDPLTKTLIANNEQNLALSERTLRAMDWKNQELDNQTKMIQQAGFQFNEDLMKSNEALMKSNEAWAKSHEALMKSDGEPRNIVDKDTALIINLMANQSSPQLKLLFGNLDASDFEMNGVTLT